MLNKDSLQSAGLGAAGSGALLAVATLFADNDFWLQLTGIAFVWVALVCISVANLQTDRGTTVKNQEKLWEMERRFWLDGVDFYEANLADDAVMLFPEPIGSLKKKQTLEAIASAPRWVEVAMNATRQTLVHKYVTILTYKATARRQSDEESYQAHAVSVYRRSADGWSLVYHQQIPIRSQ